MDWFDCACCPPNLSRTISSIEKYITTETGGELYTHLYLGYEIEFSGFSIKQTVDFGNICGVSFEIDTSQEAHGAFNFRMPDWAGGCEIYVNDEKIKEPRINNGYIKWMDSEKIEICFAMPVLQIAAHPKARANTGKVAMQRGPL